MRVPTVLAAALALIVTGVVAGAAGQALILGQANSAGFSNTSVTTNTNSGSAFQVTQQGTGTAVRGVAGIGIAGFFTSSNGSGVSGVVANQNNYGVYAANDSATEGNGAALRANGQENYGINATSNERTAVVATANGCTGFLCGAPGVDGTGAGLAGGVHGTGFLGVFGEDSTGTGDGFGLFTNDDALVGGDLTVNGTCTGCTLAVTAVNGSADALGLGDAVTATGVTADGAGNLLVTVAPAAAGDQVFGIVAGGFEVVDESNGDVQVFAYKASGPSAPAGSPLKVITGGIVAFAAADASGGAIAAGDPLVASSSVGSLAKAGPETASLLAFGTALGTLDDGRVVVYIR